MMRLALFSSAPTIQVAVSVRSSFDVRIFWHEEDPLQMRHIAPLKWIIFSMFSLFVLFTDYFMSQLCNFMKMKAISADLKIIYPFL